MNLFRTTFYQNVQTLRLYKNIKVSTPRKEINLKYTTPHKKTIFLDLDETLVHTDEHTTQYSVKMSFPIQGSKTIKLSKIAEIIIFTASSRSYADVVLDYLDPNKKYISHRLYREHCTLEKGYYLKDLRCVNRYLENVVIVDNLVLCYILQPENGIPIIPFYHNTSDRQLQSLLQFLKQSVKYQDIRDIIRSTFFWHKYIQEQGDARRIFLNNYKC